MNENYINLVLLRSTLYDLDLTDDSFELNLLNSPAFLDLLNRVANLTPGSNGYGLSKMVTVYSSNTEATTPTSGSYNWTTNKVESLDSNWTRTKPANTTLLKMAYGIAQEKLKNITWGEPIYLDYAGNGGGEDDDNNTSNRFVLLTIYTTNSGNPGTPYDSNYNFETKTLTNILAGWSETYPISVPEGHSIWYSLGLGLENSTTVKWSYPVENKVNPTTEPDNFRLLTIYLATDETLTAAPKGGYYVWESKHLLAPDGWRTTFPTSTKPIWMSQGLGRKNTTEVEWSFPTKVLITPKVELEDFDLLTIFLKLNNQLSDPSRPEGGSYNYETKSLTPPSNWVERCPESEEGYDIWISLGLGKKTTTEVVWTIPRKDGSIPDFSDPGYTEYKLRLVSIFLVVNLGVIPTKPEKTEGTWDWDNDEFTNCPVNWVTTRDEAPITSGKVRYRCTRFFLTTGDDDWQDPVIDLIGNVEETIIPAYGTAIVYKASITKPSTPNGNGEYDYSNNTLITPPVGWLLLTNNVTPIGNEIIWYSIGSFKQGSNTVWSEPLPYITKEDIIANSNSNTKSFGIAIYTASSKSVETIIAPYKNSGKFDFSTGKMSEFPASWWKATPEEALAYYKSNASPSDIGKVWVSFNNYSASFVSGVADTTTVESTGWTTPVPYINLDDVLSRASENLLAIADKAVSDAVDIIHGELGRFYDALNSLDGVYSTIDSLKVLYDWMEVGSYTESELYEGTIPSSITSKLDLLTNCVGSLYYNKVVVLNGLAYKYTASSALLTTELNNLKTTVNDLGEVLRTLNTSEITQLPGKILALTSSVEGNELEISKLKTSYASLDPDAIIALVIEEYNGTLETAFLNLYKDKISLGIVHLEGDGTTKGSATIYMYYGDGTTKTEISSSEIILNGDVIAKAIATLTLNLNNRTYLNSNGDVILGGGTSGNSNFWANGSGNISGNLITWGPMTVNSDGTATVWNQQTGTPPNNPFGVKIKGHIDAESGSFGPWTLGKTKVSGLDYPVMIGLISGLPLRIEMSPYALSCTNGNSVLWHFDKNGNVIIHDGAIKGELVDNVYKLEVKGGIYASYGIIGDLSDSTKGWKIGTENGNGCMYTGDPNLSDPYLLLSIDRLEAGSNNLVNWRLSKDGSGWLGKGGIRWDANGTNLTLAGWKVTSNDIISSTNTLHLKSTGTIYSCSEGYTGEVSYANAYNPTTKTGVHWGLSWNGDGFLANGGIRWNGSNKQATCFGFTCGDLELSNKVDGVVSKSHVNGIVGGYLHLLSDGTIFNTETYASEATWRLSNDGSGWFGKNKDIMWDGQGMQVGGWTIYGGSESIENTLQQGAYIKGGNTWLWANGDIACVLPSSSNISTAVWALRWDGTGWFGKNKEIRWDVDKDSTGMWIGGWQIVGGVDPAITGGNCYLDAAGTIKNTTKINGNDAWHLDADGSGWLAGKNIYWDSTGKVTFTTSITDDLKLYIHIRYAKDDKGTGISATSGSDLTYMGIYSGPQKDASKLAVSDYTWTKISDIMTNAEWLEKVQACLNDNKTVIDGSHITTGTIDAARINTVDLSVSKINGLDVSKFICKNEKGSIYCELAKRIYDYTENNEHVEVDYSGFLFEKDAKQLLGSTEGIYKVVNNVEYRYLTYKVVTSQSAVGSENDVLYIVMNA